MLILDESPFPCNRQHDEVVETAGVLTDKVAPKASAWTEHKAASAVIQRGLGGTLTSTYARDLSACAMYLALDQLHDGAKRLRPFVRCKKRWCPVCSWRLSLQRWGLLAERLPQAIEQAGCPVKFLMLTLTVKNVHTDELRASVGDLIASFRRLTKRKDWPALGWMRSLEITWPRPGQAHPHIHVLIAVKSSYFTHGYITKATWQAMWRKSANLDYDPVIDVRKVKPLRDKPDGMPDDVAEALGGAAEVSKYVTKPDDLSKAAKSGSADIRAVIHAMAALKGRRLVDAGGFLRGIFSEHSDDDDDTDELPGVETIATFAWRAVQEVYYRSKKP